MYSTASYQSLDLRGIHLSDNFLAGWSFRDQNLTNAFFKMRRGSTSRADFTRADLRGARFSSTFLTNSFTRNAILPTGKIAGLRLSSNGQRLLIRDYDGTSDDSVEASLDLVVESRFSIRANGAIELQFEEDEWNSTISFAPQIPVSLGGELVLSFTPEVDLATQIGRIFDVFDWTGVDPVGEFSVVSDPQLRWDVTNLYTLGTVQLIAVPEPSSALLLLMSLVFFCNKSIRVRFSQ